MHELILAVLKEQSPLGVTEIAEQIDRPRSTVDYYLKKQQNYFVQDGRKWRLPDTFDDLWDESFIQNLRDDLEVIFDRNNVEALFNEVEAGSISRTDLLIGFKGMRVLVGNINRMVKFIETNAIERLNQTKA